MERWRTILSVDGGGVRGIVPARIIAHLENLMGRPCSEVFDLIAGTSTGAIISLGLVVPHTHRGEERGYTGEELVNVYLENAAYIFERSIFHRIIALDDLLEQRYPVAHLEKVLERYFMDMSLSQLRREVVVPTYDMVMREPYLFERSIARHDATQDYLVWHAARATSAAPTYFEPYKVADPGGTPHLFVDGGVVANNPTMCALARAQEHWPGEDRVRVLSIGTGDLSEWIEHDKALGWGLAGWAQPLVDVIFDGGSDLVDRQMSMILGKEKYTRLQLPLDDASQRLDDASEKNLQALIRHADRVIEHNASELDELARFLVDNAELG